MANRGVAYAPPGLRVQFSHQVETLTDFEVVVSEPSTQASLVGLEPSGRHFGAPIIDKFGAQPRVQALRVANDEKVQVWVTLVAVAHADLVVIPVITGVDPRPNWRRISRGGLPCRPA